MMLASLVGCVRVGLGKLRKDDEIRGYDKIERRNAIVKILAEALGETHRITQEVKECHQKQTTGETRDSESYCQNRLFCDVCSAMRFRLLKGIFYLRYQRELKPFYTVVAKPKTPLGHDGDLVLAQAFEAQKHELFRHFDSFLGGMELTWTDRQPEIGTLWPHLHVLAQGRRKEPLRTFQASVPTELEIKELPVSPQEIDAALWHHCKPLPISWFPEKYPGTNIANLNNFRLTDEQKRDINYIVESHYPLIETASIEKLIFYGRYEMGIYWNDNEIRFILQSYPLDQRMGGINQVEKRAGLVRSACYYYLTLLKGDSESEARRKIALSDAEYRNFRREKNQLDIEEKAFKLLKDLKIKGEIKSWSLPDSIPVEEMRVIAVALEDINLVAITNKLEMSKSSIERILRRYGLNHRDRRSFLKRTGIAEEEVLKRLAKS